MPCLRGGSEVERKICITATDAVMCVGEEAAIGDTESKWGKGQARLLSQPG